VPRLKIDKIDRRILADLQSNGRMTNVELAQNAGISAPPCLRRVRNLEEMGLIKGYFAKIDQVALGYPVTVIALVKLNQVADKELKQFEDHLSNWSVIREAVMMTGDHDFMLKIVAKDWDDYQKFLTEKLLSLSNVANVKSSLTIKVSKDEPGVPIE
jgi:DNA-binding Lrp family transcriptional regulator